MTSAYSDSILRKQYLGHSSHGAGNQDRWFNGAGTTTQAYIASRQASSISIPHQATYSLLGLMIVFLAMSVLEILIGTMSISRYGVMTVYRVIIMDLMSDIV